MATESNRFLARSALRNAFRSRDLRAASGSVNRSSTERSMSSSPSLELSKTSSSEGGRLQSISEKTKTIPTSSASSQSWEPVTKPFIHPDWLDEPQPPSEDVIEEKDEGAYDKFKIPDLDAIFETIDPLPPHIEAKMTKDFEPCERLSTPYACDVDESKVIRGGDQKYLGRLNGDRKRKDIQVFDEPHVYMFPDEHGVVGCHNSISCSSLASGFFSPFIEDVVIANIMQSANWSKRHQPSNKWHGCENAQDILDKWTVARNNGTDMHEKIECYLNREDIPVYNEQVESRYPLAVEAIERYWAEFGWETWETEPAVYAPDLRLAGRVDCIARRKKDGRKIIIDWKFTGPIGPRLTKGESPKMAEHIFESMTDSKYSKYCVQTAIYAYIMRYYYGYDIAEMWIMRIDSVAKFGSKNPPKVHMHKVPWVVFNKVVKLMALRKHYLQKQLLHQEERIARGLSRYETEIKEKPKPTAFVQPKTRKQVQPKKWKMPLPSEF